VGAAPVRAVAGDGSPRPGPRDRHAHRSFNAGEILARFILANRAAILADAYVVPEAFEGRPFLGGAARIGDAWLAPGVDPEARRHFARNTCNGCHSLSETGTQGTHVGWPLLTGGEVSLSGCMTGITVADPLDGTSRRLDDLARRAADLRSVVCPPLA
jgi:hypothetical protein